MKQIKQTFYVRQQPTMERNGFAIKATKKEVKTNKRKQRKRKYGIEMETARVNSIWWHRS